MQERGLITIADPGSDKPLLELPTQQCVHCGGHFPKKPAEKLVGELYTAEDAKRMQESGKTMRGWCRNCNGPVCGPGCAACVHVEQMLENIEAGRPLDYKPIKVSFHNIMGQ